MVSFFLRSILGAVCKIDAREYRKALTELAAGPMILAINHINFVEVPILASYGCPRRVTGLAKEESWENPALAFLMNTYSAVPLDRDGSYTESFRRVREVMAKGVFMIVAPEGSRSKNGVLQKGKGGIIQLSLATGAPVLPVVHFGGEKIWENLKHFKRTPFHIKVGRPFRFKCDGGRPGKSLREQMTLELMGQLAALLPEEMRGEYAEQALRKTEYLEFL
ncbi:putative 1-acylglycerol-3-phosphate O-acyltransferase [Spirochaetia bacterium]|nr:putative 1-acylglycerol-3-phosphate O-acyltransferase [Spirochaetia bacterium]